MIKVYFCKSKTIFGWLIRLFTFSNWNHVGIEIDGIVFDSDVGRGVTIWDRKKFINNYEKVVTSTITDVNTKQALSFLNAQVGKGYDYKALFALPFRKPWQNGERWYCPELVAAALIEGGGMKKFNIEVSRLTQRDLYLILPKSIKE
jgi:uncharacterized protein YycO